MVPKIVWSPEAIDTYNAIIQYLHDEWTDREVYHFGKKVAFKIHILQMQPKSGRLLNNRRAIYRTLIHKKTTLVYRYRVRKNEIELVTFWNNAQNPKRLKY